MIKMLHINKSIRINKASTEWNFIGFHRGRIFLFLIKSKIIIIIFIISIMQAVKQKVVRLDSLCACCVVT